MLDECLHSHLLSHPLFSISDYSPIPSVSIGHRAHNFAVFSFIVGKLMAKCHSKLPIHSDKYCDNLILTR